MTTLDIGSKCHSCGLVDFLPFPCASCTHVFCREHIHGHGCADAAGSDSSAAPRQQLPPRTRGTCARAGCSAETLESIGGLEDGKDGAGAAQERIAREVRCAGCGGAFCVSHRSQDGHGCSAPRDYNVRHDAGIARREHAQEVLARTMPSAVGKKRMAIPDQVDRTRPTPKADPSRLPPSVIAERERGNQAAAAAATPTPTASSSTTRSSAPPTTSPAAATAAAPVSAVNAKFHKLHCIKLRSLAQPLDAKVPRDASRAVEWTVDDDDGARVRQWLAAATSSKYAPGTTGAALSTAGRKVERCWVPDVMSGGKLFDRLTARAKLSGGDVTVLVIAQRPGTRSAVVLDLARAAGDQMSAGDVLVLVRGWKEA